MPEVALGKDDEGIDGGGLLVNDPPPPILVDGEPAVEFGDPNPGVDDGKLGCPGAPGMFIFGGDGNPGGVNGVPGVEFGGVPPGESGASGLAGTRSSLPLRARTDRM